MSAAPTPAVSIVLPTHNRRATLGHAIDSVLRQTFTDFELIVADDGSTEDVRGLVEGIADPRLRYLRLPLRVGPARARNAALRLARAELFAFQDSDDEWLPDKLERQVALMRSGPPDLGLVVGAFRLVEPHGTREIRSAALERGEDYGLAIIQGVPLVTPLWLLRRDAFERAGRFDESLASSEDYELAFRLSRVCRFRAVPERVLVKTGHEGSLSANVDLLVRGLETVYARYPEFWRPYPAEEKRLLALIEWLHARRGARRASVVAMLRNLRRHPWQPRVAARLVRTVASPAALRAYAEMPGRWVAARRGASDPRGPRVMTAFGQCYPRATFVQIGANDGDKHDPLRATLVRHRWSGVMVEPVPYVFARLARNYGAVPGIALENVAIAAGASAPTLPFYYVAQAAPDEALPDWYDELGSFRREVLMSHAHEVPDLEKRVVTTQVPCLSFDELCRRHRLDTVDLVHMDTEGYDGQLLRSLDFARRRPLLLIYEHKHLGDAERRDCQALLRREGYGLFEEGADSWCADLRARDARHRRFLRAWRKLAPGDAQVASIHS